MHSKFLFPTPSQLLSLLSTHPPQPGQKTKHFLTFPSLLFCDSLNLIIAICVTMGLELSIGSR